MRNQDSIQSISDDEDDEGNGDNDLGEVRLCSHSSNRKVQLPVLLQLDLLKGNKDIPTTSSREGTYGNQFKCSSHKACRIGDFKDKGEARSQTELKIHGDTGEDSISDEDKTVLSNFSVTSRPAHFQKSHLHVYGLKDQNKDSAWSSVFEEADNLVSLPRKSGVSPKRKSASPRSGNRSRLLSSSSIHNKSTKNTSHGLPSIMNEFEMLSAQEGNHGRSFGVNSTSESFLDIEEQKHEGFFSRGKTDTVPSVTELLEDLQEKSAPSNMPFDVCFQNAKRKQIKTRVSGKRTASLGSRFLDSEEQPDFIGCTNSSEDEETYQSHLKGSPRSTKSRTMAELFQEAFSTAEISESQFSGAKQAGTSYYKRLQQVMQSEKDAHMDFLREIPKGQVGSRFIDARILSRALEAKLIVCECLLKENTEHPTESDHCRQVSKCTVIFSSKICDNVNLEIGNVVRIHPPWRQVVVDEDQKIILSTYFTQINSEMLVTS